MHQRDAKRCFSTTAEFKLLCFAKIQHLVHLMRRENSWGDRELSIDWRNVFVKDANTFCQSKL